MAQPGDVEMVLGHPAILDMGGRCSQEPYLRACASIAMTDDAIKKWGTKSLPASGNFLEMSHNYFTLFYDVHDELSFDVFIDMMRVYRATNNLRFETIQLVPDGKTTVASKGYVVSVACWSNIMETVGFLDLVNRELLPTWQFRFKRASETMKTKKTEKATVSTDTLAKMFSARTRITESGAGSNYSMAYTEAEAGDGIDSIMQAAPTPVLAHPVVPLPPAMPTISRATAPVPPAGGQVVSRATAPVPPAGGQVVSRATAPVPPAGGQVVSRATAPPPPA